MVVVLNRHNLGIEWKRLCDILRTMSVCDNLPQYSFEFPPTINLN